MAALQTRLTDLVTAVGTDIKQLRVWLTGSSTGDLTGLTTTAKTSIVAAINEVKAAATGAPPTTSETIAGIIRTATQAEVGAGTLDFIAVSPLKHRTDMVAYAQPKSANLTALAGFTTSTDPLLAANSDTIIPSQKAIKAYADNLIDANNAFRYMGGIDCSTNPNYPAANAGQTWKVTVAGKIGGAAGIPVEVGDTITCLVDASVTGNQAAVGANWLVMQTNVDGAVTGPAVSVAGDFATFSGVTGKVVQDSGLSFDTDVNMAAGSATRVPSQSAVVGYTYSKAAIGNPDTDLAAAYAAAKA